MHFKYVYYFCAQLSDYTSQVSQNIQTFGQSTETTGSNLIKSRVKIFFLGAKKYN